MEVMTEEKKGFKKTDVGLIPEDWQIHQLIEVGEVIMGQSPPGSSYNQIKKGVPLINGPTEFTNISPKKIQWTTNPTKFCKPDDILICVRGSSTGRINISNDEYCIGRGIAAIRAENKNSNKFLEYQVRNAVTEIVSKTSGSTFPNVDGKTLKSIKIPFPPSIEEQQAIASALSDVDELIRSLDGLIQKKQAIKKGTMQQLLTGKKRLPGFDEEWEEVKLIEIADKNSSWSFTGGPFGSDLKKSHYTEKGIRVIQLQNIGDGRFIEDSKVFTTVEKADELESANIFPGEIIISKMGDPVGRACIIPDTHDRYLMCSDGIRLKVDQYTYDSNFIFYTINFKPFRTRVINASSGSTRKRIGLNDLKKIYLFVPGIKEQKAIGSILSDMDRELQTLRQKREKYVQIKQGMMQELLTGKTRLV